MEGKMEALTYTTARQNLARTMDKVCDDLAPVIITRKKHRSVVMMSLEEYNGFSVQFMELIRVAVRKGSSLKENRKIVFSTEAWEDYQYWQKNNSKILKRISSLIRESLQTPANGLGIPEPLKNVLSGYWSRRIDHTHRMVYRLHNENLEIIQLRYHY
jgi:toxin YoeB